MLQRHLLLLLFFSIFFLGTFYTKQHQERPPNKTVPVTEYCGCRKDCFLCREPCDNSGFLTEGTVIFVWQENLEQAWRWLCVLHRLTGVLPSLIFLAHLTTFLCSLLSSCWRIPWTLNQILISSNDHFCFKPHLITSNDQFAFKTHLISSDDQFWFKPHLISSYYQFYFKPHLISLHQMISFDSNHIFFLSNDQLFSSHILFHQTVSSVSNHIWFHYFCFVLWPSQLAGCMVPVKLHAYETSSSDQI